MCIRCAGIHRHLGVHISKVKSVNLDSWTPEQIATIQKGGNGKARDKYEANLPANFRRPQDDYGVEQLIRSKYERKLYISKESPAPAVTTGNKSRSSHAPSPAGVVKEKKSSSGGKKTHSQQEQKKEQQTIQKGGNGKARDKYEANLPANFRRPQDDYGVEQLIRSKYERKLYISKESPAPAVTTGNKSRSSHAPSPAGVVKEKKSSSGGKKTHSQQEQKKEQQVCVCVCVCAVK
jgi:hypothetical protein